MTRRFQRKLPEIFPFNMILMTAYEPAAPDTQYRSQAARGEVSPRRYVGRAGAVPQSGSGEVGSASKTRPEAWSLRLVVAVSLITALGMALRLTGTLTTPIDSPVGTEATHAAFVQALSGGIGGTLDPVRYFPPPAPWYGSVPVNPGAGLPIYGWLTAAVMQLVGAGEWIGRVIAICFSVLAGLVLFGLVRRTSGARAGLYALLFYSVSPLSVVTGQQFAPSSLILALQALAVGMLTRWRLSVSATRPGGSSSAFSLAVGAGVLSALVDPGSIFLAVPAAYLALTAQDVPADDDTGSLSLRKRKSEAGRSWREAWNTSPNKGKLTGYATALFGGAVLYLALASISDGAIALEVGDGGGGVGAVLASLLSGGTYVQIIGALMEKVLTIVGALLLFGGLLRGSRRPMPLLLQVWLLAGLVHVLVDASRATRHDDVLLPVLLPVCALVGIGAAWAGSLPARVWLAITEQRRDTDSGYVVSPHTSWLLDLPEERLSPEKPSRPQAQLALGRSVAYRAQKAGARARRAWAMGIGNLVVLAAFAAILATNWQTVQARIQPSVAGIELKEIGREVRAATSEGSRLIIVGPSAPELFFTSGRTGWALSSDDFGMAQVRNLQGQGAAYLLSTDQEWLGHHPDYKGLLTDYSVLKLGRAYILFDLNTRPAASDRLYFLESGHTLGGEFRRFWEKHGDVRKLGYPISEEVQVVNPVDGQKRTVQYFERAVLEYHSEFAGTSNSIMLAAVGRWVTVGRDFQPVAPFKSTPDRAYFQQTGHSLKQAFLRYWQREGGVGTFGYPISEELPEISASDGKVYTVQYFERARFEWHPIEAGTPSEVQLGLIGKQAWEMK